jgi:hypothetical protein
MSYKFKIDKMCLLKILFVQKYGDDSNNDDDDDHHHHSSGNIY